MYQDGTQDPEKEGPCGLRLALARAVEYLSSIMDAVPQARSGAVDKDQTLGLLSADFWDFLLVSSRELLCRGGFDSAVRTLLPNCKDPTG
jgi:hypothetical protein